VESVGWFHDVPIMHLLTAFRILYLSAELQRKLSLYSSEKGSKAVRPEKAARLL
jgi:hypothetical protein